MKLSVIIANYNYRDFVVAAIESALAVDWPDKEVIVVDDASTDDSRSVIEAFGDRVAAYFRPKSHQLGAHMFGFEQSTGEISFFSTPTICLNRRSCRRSRRCGGPGFRKFNIA